ncbi:MAG: ribonuclease E/G [Lachnospiraceae bacterium]|nr:ribonuclease E/G [Lachnospiraceae bacterium]
MGNKLVITKEDFGIVSSVFDGNNMIQVHVEKEEKATLLGNIYIGKVKNIVKNINAAFVEIADGTMCYLPLGEVIAPVFTDSRKDSNIRIGDELIVQVTKEDIKTKAPVITTNFNFTGKYTVLAHGKASVGISSKIEDEAERKRLKKLVSGYVGEHYGFILRTNANHAPDECIEAEIKLLKEMYDSLLQYGVKRTCYSQVYKTQPAFICAIRDGFAQELDAIITDDPVLYEEMKDYLSNYQKEDLEKLSLYQDPTLSLGKLYGVEAKLENALKEKVWLKSGGSLIIQPTEALTVIDVNTGKAVNGKKKVQETFLKVNLEAAEEIAKQIRLRNLSGIIIVDFISMDDKAAQKKVMQLLAELFKKDPIKTTLIDMTALNLVEITRKKVRKPLHEQIK